MSPRSIHPSLPAGLLAILVWSLSYGSSFAQPLQQPGLQPPIQGLNPQDPGQQDGVEVLTRGPIHEAFAEPVGGVPQAGPVIVKQPPPAVEEMPPDRAPQGDMQWIPGY